MKICSKRTKLHNLKKFLREACPQTALANAWLRHESQAASRMQLAHPPKKLSSPLAKPTYAHGLLLRNVFEELRS